MPNRCLSVALRETAVVAALMRGSGARLLLTCGLVGAVCVGSAMTALAGGNCAGSSSGRIPITDLGEGVYQGFEGGLYPGGVNVRPSAHDNDADRAARLELLDAAGQADALTGRIVFLTIGMSNTTQETQAFIPLATADPRFNRSVVLVDGAQGGWSADRVVDPTQNAAYWSTVESRLAAAGVTDAQVQALWLKEADARPTLPFPDDVAKLQHEIESIIGDIKVRFPNARQLYLSSRIYAGYATSDLNPEPFAYQSGFAVKGIVRDQLQGMPSLNFDLDRGPVGAPWLSWSAYLWADGLVPRSDGLTWECADLQTDGTHPAASGRQKVAAMLLSFFKSDPIASRWFIDCAPADPGVFAVPPRVLGLSVTQDDALTWNDIDPVAGPDTTYDVVIGSVQDLRRSRDFLGALCAVSALPSAAVTLPAPDPPAGEAVYYIVRGRNACGDGTYAEGWDAAGPRAFLDSNSPCR
jgi:hypothetical protein